MEPTVNKWRVSQATHSFSTLRTVVNQLTEAEIHAALELESQTQRRASIINRLIARASRLAETKTTRLLKEKYHGKDSKRS